MKILGIRTISGPNVFHHRPVLIMTLDLQEYAEKPSSDIPGFTDRLVGRLPKLFDHRCSPGHKGGFIERLHRGTYMGHIIEHIALEFSEMAGIKVGFGKTVYGGAPGVYQVAVRYQSEEGMKYLLETAVMFVESVVRDEAFPVEERIDEARRIVRKHQLGPSTKAIVEAAERRHIPWRRLDDLNFIQLGYGKYRRFIQATTTSITSDIAVEIAQDKELTKRMLNEASIRVPRGKSVGSLEEAIEAFREMSGPVVVKPQDGNHGRGVSINITDEKTLAKAFDLAHEHCAHVLIEECFRGDDYRVVVVGGKVVAAAHRIPAHVVGDGIHTIDELVAMENKNPLRGEGHEKPLTAITFDDENETFLKRQNISRTDVPGKGKKVFLRETANLSTGGSAIDVTDDVHPEVRAVCERAARVIGLDVCGIDFLSNDIALPLAEQSGGIIEVNAGPGIRMHHYPSQGKSRDVGGAIVDFMFRDQPSGRIPIVAITGTNGKTTVTRLLSHVLSELGQKVGTTTTDGIFINGIQVADGDTTGPLSARAVLSDPEVEVAVLETARGGIVKRGLGFDWCDVGIITNVAADHIGQDGIEDIEDILRIKSLVVERVRPGGTVILNADVPELVALTEKPKMEISSKNLIYFSMKENSPVVRHHVSQGGSALFLRGDQVIISRGHLEKPVVRASGIPLTLGGTARFHIANVMSVLAACEALSLPHADTVRGLMSFDHLTKNKGRTNLYEVGGGYVLLDYGHNPEAFRSTGEMVHGWDVTRVTAVVGAPGDRSDEMIRLAGEAAAKVFDKIIVREDIDTRGRLPGVVAGLLEDAIFRQNPRMDCRLILDPNESLRSAIHDMIPRELVVYFYEDLEESTQVIMQAGGKELTDYGKVLREKAVGVGATDSWLYS